VAYVKRWLASESTLNDDMLRVLHVMHLTTSGTSENGYYTPAGECAIVDASDFASNIAEIGDGRFG
jgi:hypothetical protein